MSLIGALPIPSHVLQLKVLIRLKNSYEGGSNWIYAKQMWKAKLSEVQDGSHVFSTSYQEFP